MRPRSRLIGGDHATDGRPHRLVVASGGPPGGDCACVGRPGALLSGKRARNPPTAAEETMADDLSDLLPPGSRPCPSRTPRRVDDPDAGGRRSRSRRSRSGAAQDLEERAQDAARNLRGQPASGRQTYIVLDDDRVTFRRAPARHAQARRTILIADGVKKGDRVAIVARNLPEWSAAFWAGILTGAIVTPLNAWWTGGELEYGLQDSGSKILISDAERWARIATHIDACPAVEKIWRDPRARTDRPSSRRHAGRRHWQAERLGEAARRHGAGRAPSPPTTTPRSSTPPAPRANPVGAIITHRNIVSNIFNALSAQARCSCAAARCRPRPIRRRRRRRACFGALLPCDRLLRRHGSRHAVRQQAGASAPLGRGNRRSASSNARRSTAPAACRPSPGRSSSIPVSRSSTCPRWRPSPMAARPPRPTVRRIKQRFPKSQPGQGWGMTETPPPRPAISARIISASPPAAARPPPPAKCASSRRTARTRRSAKSASSVSRPDRGARLLAEAQGNRRDLRGRLGEDRRPSPASTTRASSISSTAPRTC